MGYRIFSPTICVPIQHLLFFAIKKNAFVIHDTRPSKEAGNMKEISVTVRLLFIHKRLCRVNFANLPKIDFYVF